MKLLLAKIEKLVFYLFIFLIPVQTKLLIANWTPGRAYFNEWTVAFLHGTDILIIIMLLARFYY